MNGRGKSDSPVIPAKSLNKAEGSAVGATEGRGLAKGNSPERNTLGVANLMGGCVLLMNRAFS
jgi:hypothetical protein